MTDKIKINLLTEKIKERTSKRFEEEFKKFVEAVSSNEIGRLLQIRINDKESQNLVNCSGVTGGVFFNSRFENLTEFGKHNSNILEIREKLLEIYEKAETDKLLLDLKVLNDYIAGGNEFPESQDDLPY